MSRPLVNKILVGGVGVMILAGLVTSTIHIQKYKYRPYLHDALYLPSGKFIQQLSLGYREVVADMVWFSAVQYFGDYRKGNHGLRYFEGLMDIITRLDPHFIFAYKFGALVIADDLGSLDRGIALLKKGIQSNPTSWELMFEIGFLHYVNARDYEMAARYFDMASNVPGSPEYAKRFAGFVYDKAGSDQASIRIWEEYMEVTDNPFLKELAERYISKLKTTQSTSGAPSDV